MNDRGRVAVIFGRRHDAVFAVAGVKDRDADHQRGGEVPTTGVSDRKGLRQPSGSCLGGGDHPRATGARCVRPRAAITARAKPKRPRARVADPSQVDGVRPWAGPRISANRSGIVLGSGDRVPQNAPSFLMAISAFSSGLPTRLVQNRHRTHGPSPAGWRHFGPTSMICYSSEAAVSPGGDPTALSLIAVGLIERELGGIWLVKRPVADSAATIESRRLAIRPNHSRISGEHDGTAEDHAGRCVCLRNGSRR